MTIDWAVVLFEAVNFGVLMMILTHFVFRPVARVLDERRAAIVEREAQTRAREQQAEAQRGRFEQELARIDAIADQRIAASLAEAQVRAEATIDEARTLARTILAKSELELDQTRLRALEQFRREIMALGIDAAGRVVHELGLPEVGMAFVRRALHSLADALAERQPLRGELRVAISPELDPREVADLARRELPGLRVEVEVDPALIAGARLVADGYEVSASAGASLESWYRRMLVDAGASAA